MKLAAVLLAAGRSRRFGAEDKLLADVSGQTMLARALATLSSINADHRAAVVSSREAECVTAASGFEIIRNDAPEAGLSYSITLGVRWARAQSCDALLLAVADQPLLTAQSLAELIDAFRLHGGLACLADDTHRGNPAVFSSVYFGELLALRGDCGAKAVLRAHEDALTIVRCHLPDELSDADEPQALAALRERLQGRL